MKRRRIEVLIVSVLVNVSGVDLNTRQIGIHEGNLRLPGLPWAMAFTIPYTVFTPALRVLLTVVTSSISASLSSTSSRRSIASLSRFLTPPSFPSKLRFKSVSSGGVSNEEIVRFRVGVMVSCEWTLVRSTRAARGEELGLGSMLMHGSLKLSSVKREWRKLKSRSRLFNKRDHMIFTWPIPNPESGTDNHRKFSLTLLHLEHGLPGTFALDSNGSQTFTQNWSYTCRWNWKRSYPSKSPSLVSCPACSNDNA